MNTLEFLTDVSPIKAAVALLAALLTYRWLKRIRSNLPPGPFALPIVGCLPFMERKAERTFGGWARKYGPVITVQLGWNQAVVLNSYESIVQAFTKQSSQFIGRQQNLLSKIVSQNGHGIIFTANNDVWKIQRKFGSKALSGTGLRGKHLEAQILGEAEILCDELRNNAGKPTSLKKILVTAVVRVIEKLTSGGIAERMNHIEYLAQVVDKVHKRGLSYYVLAVLPWTRFFPPMKNTYQTILRNRSDGLERYRQVVKEHERTLDPTEPRDFIDLFLLEMKQNKATFTEKQLIIYISDLYGAGAETSTTTLRWILRYLVVYPKVQAKLYEEIERVIGDGGQARLTSDLPYTKAVIQETLRVCPVAALGVPHLTTEDVDFMGYRIPKNTQVFSNIWHVHHDPAIWSEPDKFDPERHINKDGKFVKSEKIIPFSVGPRNCLGENLARAEIFLFLVSIVQKFEICANPTDPYPCMEGRAGIVYGPEDYDLVIKQR